MATSQASSENLIRFAMQISCDQLDARLDAATLADRFEGSLRASHTSHGFKLRRPSDLRDLVEIASRLPIPDAFDRLLRCVKECSASNGILESLHLASDQDVSKLLRLQAAVGDSLDSAMRDEAFCQFLTDIGAGEMAAYATDVHRFVTRLINAMPALWYEGLVLAAIYADRPDLLAAIAPLGADFEAELPAVRRQLGYVTTHEEFLRARQSVEEKVSQWIRQNLVRLDLETHQLMPMPAIQPPTPHRVDADGCPVLRNYQVELAEAAVNGQNSIVIAPTGSGKTLVAVRVTLAVLEREPDAKVAFLVPTTNLVQQQLKEFKRCMPPRWRDRACGIHGGDDEQSRMPFTQAVKEFSVLVVTTQILLNELNRPSGSGYDGLNGDVATFRLIIFDECHSCLGNHPSRQVMLHYMRQKQTLAPGKRLPQILGLTASPGTGKATRQEDANEHLVRLCSSLDCPYPVTVQSYTASMLDVTSNPDCRMHPVGSKPRDTFNVIINRLMAAGEELLRTFEVETAGLPAATPPRCTPSYVNFCSNIKYNMHAADQEVSKNLLACSRYLGSCNKAQMISQFFRSVDALKFLEEQLRPEDEMSKPPACEAEDKLRRLLTELMPELLRFCTSSEAMASPPLDRLIDILRRQFAELPESRAIVFVQEKFYARVLAELLAESPNLGLPRATYVTGATSGGAAGGTKSADQQARLEDFRRGKYKVIACTSVTEEGLDIPACNLVVRYCHVTNEISMVQSKGRGRAKESSYHVIIAESQDWLYEKERTNQQRDSMMREAVQFVTAMDPLQLQAKMTEDQLLWVTKADGAAVAAAAAPTEAASALSNSHDVICGKCQTLLTHSSRLRLIDGIHRVALDADMFTDRVRGQKGDKQKLTAKFEMIGVDLVCICCGFKVAKVASHDGLFFPLVCIEPVLFRRSDTQDLERPARQWKKTNAFLKIENVTRADRTNWACRMPTLPGALRSLVG